MKSISFPNAAMWGVVSLATVSLSMGLNAQQATPPPPQAVTATVPPPVVLPAPPSVPNAADRPLTADEAARIALRLQPNITVAQAGITMAQGITQQTRSGLLPNIGLGLGYSRVERLSGSAAGSGSGFSGTLSLQQLLLDFGHTRAMVEQDRALERAAAHNLTRAQQDTVLQVKQAFYQYVAYAGIATINEENVRNRQDQLALAQARLNSGLGLAADVVTAQTALSTAIQSLIQARNSADTARSDLALLMGLDPRTPIRTAMSGEPAVASNDVNAWVRTALRLRPEMLQAQEAVQAGRYGIRAAKTTNAPVLVGTLGGGIGGDGFFFQNNTVSVGVSLQIPLFDGGLTAGRVKEAQGSLESTRAQLYSVQLTVTSDVSNAYLNLRTAEQRVTAAGSEVANAREGIRIATGRYRAGLGQFLDILNAQQFLLTAQTDQAAASAAVEQAKAALSHAVGAPLGTLH